MIDLHSIYSHLWLLLFGMPVQVISSVAHPLFFVVVLMEGCVSTSQFIAGRHFSQQLRPPGQVSKTIPSPAIRRENSACSRASGCASLTRAARHRQQREERGCEGVAMPRACRAHSLTQRFTGNAAVTPRVPRCFSEGTWAAPVWRWTAGSRVPEVGAGGQCRARCAERCCAGSARAVTWFCVSPSTFVSAVVFVSAVPGVY